MAILITTLKVVGASILALAGSGATYQYVATKLDERNIPPIGRMVDVGGYKLHMIDSGVTVEDQPTVVIDAGGGADALALLLVSSEISKFNRVITYDRAGYGWSDVSPLIRTSENIVEELHTMLKNADVSGQYILIGCSFGGLNMQLFAAKYPEEVAGMVLVDASSEDAFEKVQKDMILSPTMMQVASVMAYLGIPRLVQCIPSVKLSLEKSLEKFDPSVLDAYRLKKLSTKYMLTNMQECSNMGQGSLELKRAGTSLGDIPLTVISAKKPLIEKAIPGMITQEQADTMNKGWSEVQAGLVSKSSQSKQIIAEHSGHNIPYEQPEIIVEAVREMLEGLKKYEFKIINKDIKYENFSTCNNYVESCFRKFKP